MSSRNAVDCYSTARPLSVRFNRQSFRGARPTVSSYLPDLKQISLRGVRKTRESCYKCGVDYEVPVLNLPSNVHVRPEVVSAWESFRIADQSYAVSMVSNPAYSSYALLARDGAAAAYERTVRHFEQEEDNANRHLNFVRNECRESHLCDPEVYVPPRVMEMYQKGVQDYELSLRTFESQEDAAERNFHLSEERYHRSRVDSELDHNRMIDEQLAREHRVQVDRDTHYERVRADHEVDRRNAFIDRCNASQYDMMLRRQERDREFGFRDMANFFLKNLCDSSPLRLGGR